MVDAENLEREIAEFNHVFRSIESEIGKVIVGMEHVVGGALSAIFAGGHVLMEGVPGLGKTLLVKSINEAFGLSFKRIQFTPDLMPSDVTGTQVLTEDDSGRRRFVFKPGPIFANIVLADEINRATPKTQASLLEAMEERQVTVLDQTYSLQSPFFVLATQNPIELEGTYPLPEAQLDRFLIKLKVPAPSSDQLKEILTRTTGVNTGVVRAVFQPDEAVTRIEHMKSLVRKVVVADPVLDILVHLMSSLTPGSERASEKVNTYVRFGPGPRGAQAVLLMAKVRALRESRINLAFEDIRATIVEAIRHRLILNFQAEADDVTAEEIISEVASR
jgi:MoxR-like ATPase